MEHRSAKYIFIQLTELDLGLKCSSSHLTLADILEKKKWKQIKIVMQKL